MLYVAPTLVGESFHLLNDDFDALCGKLKDGEYPHDLIRPFAEIKPATLAEFCPDCTLVVVDELNAIDNG